MEQHHRTLPPPSSFGAGGAAGALGGAGVGAMPVGRCQHCGKLEQYMLRFKEKAASVKKEVSEKVRKKLFD